MTSNDDAVTAARVVRRYPRGPESPTRRWTHHLADLNSGEVNTTVLDGAPTSQSRIERLSQLRSIRDATVFGGPIARLTTRRPYRASPEAWVTARIDYFNPRVGMQWTPQVHPGDVRDLTCYFSQLPAELSLISIALEAAALTGNGGHVTVGWVPLDQGGPVNGSVQFPIQGPDTGYTLDFAFARGTMAPPEFVMTLTGGIDWMLFNAATLRTAPLVADPVTF